MRKIRALYRNEMIKASKKTSVLVISIVMVAMLILVGLGMFAIDSSFGYIDDYYYDYDSQIEWIESDLKETEIYLKTAYTELENAQDDDARIEAIDQIKSLQSKKAYYTADLEQLRLQKENSGKDLPFYVETSISLLREERRTAEYYSAVYDLTGDSSLKAIADNANENIAALNDVIKNQSFESYCDYQVRVMENSDYSDDFQKELAIEMVELQKATYPKNTSDSNYASYQEAINKISSYKTQLHYKTDNGMPLLDDELAEIENKLAVCEYQVKSGYFDNNFSSIGGNTVMVTLMEFGLIFVIILLIILAGSSFSQEFSTGSIKLLVISPTKRWKILVAKLLSLVTIGLALILIVFVVSLLLTLLVSGTQGMRPYIFAYSGVAMQIPFFFYELLYALVLFIQALTVMIFAFMMSIVTRNTAASVATSASVYYGGSLLTSIFAIFNNSEIIKFLPFTNMDLTDRVFPNLIDGYESAMQLIAFDPPSVLFSVVYLVVLFACMLLTAFDSFIRRDI